MASIGFWIPWRNAHGPHYLYGNLRSPGHLQSTYSQDCELQWPKGLGKMVLILRWSLLPGLVRCKMHYMGLILRVLNFQVVSFGRWLQGQVWLYSHVDSLSPRMDKLIGFPLTTAICKKNIPKQKNKNLQKKLFPNPEISRFLFRRSRITRKYNQLEKAANF